MDVTAGRRRVALIRGNDFCVIDGPVRRTWGHTRDRVAVLMTNGHRYLELYDAVPWAGALVMSPSKRAGRRRDCPSRR